MAEATWSARCIRGESTNDCVEHLAEYVVVNKYSIKYVNCPSNLLSSLIIDLNEFSWQNSTLTQVVNY